MNTYTLFFYDSMISFQKVLYGLEFYNVSVRTFVSYIILSLNRYQVSCSERSLLFLQQTRHPVSWTTFFLPLTKMQEDVC